MNTRSISWILALVALSATVVASIPQGRGAGRPAPADKAQDDLSEFYFGAADWDGDGWIRYSEAEKSMGLDRAEFALFDTDRDGGVDSKEFGARYRLLVDRGGVFTPPRSKPDAPKAARKDAKALLLAYDADLDGILSESDVGLAMREAGIGDPSARVVVETLDQDKSSGLDGAELDELADLLSPARGPKRKKAALTLDELFDRTETRDARAGATIGPRRTAGPVSVYRRLDYDRSGVIDLADLEQLQRPLRSAVRPAAVLATLDSDSDGLITPEEFAAAMQ